ncbi:MAG: flavodoxin family protein [Candidatus Brocadiales bacterium]|nr:flavodoxin family protein [Candidatus Brocadiales bacterium]
MLRLVGIFGSPRRDGNSDILLNSAIKGAESNGAAVEKIIIRDLQIAPCNSCGGCWEKGDCVINDDMQKIYPKLVDADGIIVASPIYFMGVSAQLKAFIDRCQAFWARKYVLHMPIREGGRVAKGFFIATAARDSGEGLFTGAVKTIKAFFHVLDTQYVGDILCAGLEEKGDAGKKQELLQQAFDAGKQLLKLS